MSHSALAQVSSELDDFAIQRNALSRTLEEPLRTHLLKNGYTPRNAAIAANSLLDTYAQCLANTENSDEKSEPEITTVRLGEVVVAAYESPCLAEFLNNVAGIL